MSKIGSPPPQDAREYLQYNPETGEIFRIRSAASRYVGKRADTHIQHGYRWVLLLGRRYSAHRIAWFLHYGQWPQQPIDHIDRDRANNRITNLRVVSPSQSQFNRSVKRTLLPGVKRHRTSGRFEAKITKNYMAIHLGTFDTEQLAHAAYLEAGKELHGFVPVPGLTATGEAA